MITIVIRYFTANPSWLLCHYTCAPSFRVLHSGNGGNSSLRAVTRRTLCNCTPWLRGRGDLPVLLSSILQLLHLEALRGGGVDHPRLNLSHCSLSLSSSLPFFGSFDPLLLGAHRRSSTRRSRLGPLRRAGESFARRQKRSETNKHSKGGNACAAEQNEAPSDREIRLNSP